MRSQVMQTSIALHLQLSWPQWISNVSGARENSVIKELQQVGLRSRSSKSMESANHVLRAASLQRATTRHPLPARDLLTGRNLLTAPDLLTTRDLLPTRDLSPTRDRLAACRTLQTDLIQRASFRRPPLFTQQRSSDLAHSTAATALPGAAVLQHAPQSDTIARSLRKTNHAPPMQSLLSEPALTNMRQSPLTRSRLFAESAWLDLATQPKSAPAAPSESREVAPPRRADVAQPPQQQLDIGRLSDEVYRHIQRKIRIERERRGI